MHHSEAKKLGYIAASVLATVTIALYLVGTQYTWCIPFVLFLVKAISPYIATGTTVAYSNTQSASKFVLAVTLFIGIPAVITLIYAIYFGDRAQARCIFRSS